MAKGSTPQHDIQKESTTQLAQLSYKRTNRVTGKLLSLCQFFYYLQLLFQRFVPDRVHLFFKV
jgi:uncharacterized membrane protein